MNRLTLSLFILLLFPIVSLAQSSPEDIALEQYKINRTGMMLLGGWAITNIGIGLVGRNHTDGSFQYFHEGNALWNTVNLGLATVGLFTASDLLNNSEFFTVLENHHQFEKIFLLNAALDVAYITGGFYLKERSKNVVKNRERFQGYGNALILQGGFLMLFDLIMYGLHHTHSNFLNHHLQQLSFHFNSIDGMGLTMCISL